MVSELPRAMQEEINMNDIYPTLVQVQSTDGSVSLMAISVVFVSCLLCLTPVLAL